ncbi:MAG: hypothetical protein Q9190_007342 [Brigantiaea leucoxantha]
MWNTRRRLTRPDRASSLGAPTAVEPAIEENATDESGSLINGEHSISSRPAFGRKTTGDVVKDLPALPLYVMSSLGQDLIDLVNSKSLEAPAPSFERPLSDVPTASSIYSQPSPETQSSYMPHRLNIPKKSSAYANDVSPPDSLRRQEGAQDQSAKSSFEVSPITSPSTPTVDRVPPTSKNSNIPTLKKTQKFSGAGNMWSNWRARSAENKSPDEYSKNSSKTRWDDYSGERTDSEKGKPGQVTPGSVPFDSPPHPLLKEQTLGNTTTISGGTDMPKRKKVPTRSEDFTPPVREPWKGASGRQQIINPLTDKPLPPGKQAVFPAGRRWISSSPNGYSNSRDAISPTSGLALSPLSGDLTPTKQTFSRPLIEVHESEPNTPTAAVSSPSPSGAPPPQYMQPDELEKSRLTPDDTRSPLARHPSTDETQSKPMQPTPDATPNSTRETPDPEPSESAFRANLQRLNLEDQPPSRFSATTYATTNDSPPATPEISHEPPPPLPTPPSSSILNRKRPVPVAGLPAKKSSKDSPSASTSLSYRNRKSLPQSPPEAAAQTRVAGLEAKLDNLRRRKRNIQTVLHELTNVVQPSSIAYDIAARKEVKRTVEGLEREMAEVLKDEHETGLKLHRAWKREDERGDYELTGLWVRRVTT